MPISKYLSDPSFNSYVTFVTITLVFSSGQFLLTGKCNNNGYAIGLYRITALYFIICQNAPVNFQSSLLDATCYGDSSSCLSISCSKGTVYSGFEMGKGPCVTVTAGTVDRSDCHTVSGPLQDRPVNIASSPTWDDWRVCGGVSPFVLVNVEYDSSDISLKEITCCAISS